MNNRKKKERKKKKIEKGTQMHCPLPPQLNLMKETILDVIVIKFKVMCKKHIHDIM